MSMGNYPIPNADFPLSIRKRISRLNLAVRLPSLRCIDGLSLIVKSAPNNLPNTIISLAHSEEAAVNPDNSYPLAINESYPLFIKDAKECWVSSNIVPAFVIVSAEQRREG